MDSVCGLSAPHAVGVGAHSSWRFSLHVSVSTARSDEDENKKVAQSRGKKEDWASCILFAFAADMLILSNAMLSMQFVGEMLSFSGMNSDTCKKVVAEEAVTLRSILDTPKRLFPRKPPDPTTQLVELLELESKGHAAFKSKKSPGEQPLCLGLLAALNVASKVPHIEFIPDGGLRK